MTWASADLIEAFSIAKRPVPRQTISMNNPGMARREFLGGVAAASLTAAIGFLPLQSEGGSRKPAPARPVRLGAPVFDGPDDPEELALAHVKLGYRGAYCPRADLKDTARLRAIETSFRKHDVVIAEVGRWVNLLDADPEKRRQNLKAVTEGLALAEEIGAGCCVDIAGSFNPDSWSGPHPDNLTRRHFDASVENARSIIDAVKPKRSAFCYEMMGWMYPDSPESSLKLIKAVDRKAFKVHLDPCNLINSPERFYRNTALLNECFDKLGKWIVSCHAKDLAWDIELNVHFREVIPGRGSLDYATFLRLLSQLPQNPPLMLEHLANAQDYGQGVSFIRGVAQREKIAV
jgi:sugar phosphate isomerase/epimerase